MNFVSMKDKERQKLEAIEVKEINSHQYTYSELVEMLAFSLVRSRRLEVDIAGLEAANATLGMKAHWI